MHRILLLLLIFNLPASTKNAPNEYGSKGELSKNLRIESKILDYAIQYRVYLPPGYDQLNNLPVIYLADGQWYISEGDMPAVLDELILNKKIRPVIAVFIDNRDPDNLKNNRRNSQFLCNDKYVKFVTDELVLHIDSSYKTSKNADARAMMGLSFGGLNAAQFALKASDFFHLIAMQSPALHPCPAIYTGFQNTKVLPLKIFMSTGATNDTEVGTRKLKKILDDKGYDIKYQEVNEGHNWKNWKPLLDDVLLYFFST